MQNSRLLCKFSIFFARDKRYLIVKEITMHFLNKLKQLEFPSLFLLIDIPGNKLPGHLTNYTEITRKKNTWLKDILTCTYILLIKT